MSKAATLTFKPVTKSRWSDFEALFESRGAPRYCWCMAWRPMDVDRAGASNAERTQWQPKAGTRRHVVRLTL